MTKKINLIPIEHKVMAIIDNFHCDVSEVKLSPYLSIRCIDNLSADEQAIFAGNEAISQHLLRSANESEYREKNLHFIYYQSAVGEQLTRTIEQSNFVLYWYFNKPVQEPLKNNYDVFLKPDSEFDAAISALRVLNDSMVGLYPQEHFFYKMPNLESFPRATHRSHNGYQLSKSEELEPYELVSSDIETLKTLVSSIKSVKQQGLLTALRRLDNQYTRAYIADRLIDAVIALEALYAGESQSEIGLRVGLRASTFLGGSDPDSRERCFNLFNLAYDLRSKLVHGSIHNTKEIDDRVKKKGWQSSESFIKALDDMLRQSLRLILLNIQDGNLKERLHEPLDKAIRRGEVFQFPKL